MFIATGAASVIPDLPGINLSQVVALKSLEHGKHIKSYITGVFTCQGEVNPKVLAKVKQKLEPPVWIGDADDAVGHPNEEDCLALKKIITEL